MDGENKVIEFRVPALKPCLAIKKSKLEHCNHKYVEVDRDERVVNCQKCGAIVEPFEYVLQCAYEERMLFWQMDSVKDAIKKLSEERDRLEKDINNLKSQKRRLLK